jgi:ribosomal protein S6
VVQPDAEPERLAEIHARVESAIEGGQGRTLLRDDWGKRRLAYEIQKFQKGHYFLVEMLGDGKFISELERGMRLDPDVLRYLTILVDEQVKDVPARVERAEKEAAEHAERRAERERLERERQERERVEAAARTTALAEAELKSAAVAAEAELKSAAVAAEAEAQSAAPADEAAAQSAAPADEAAAQSAAPADEAAAQSAAPADEAAAQGSAVADEAAAQGAVVADEAAAQVAAPAASDDPTDTDTTPDTAAPSADDGAAEPKE